MRRRSGGRAELGGAAALFATLAPLAVLCSIAWVDPRWALPVGIAAATSIAVGGLWHERSGLGRWAVIAGMVLVPLAAFERMLASPALALTSISVVVILGWLLWSVPLAPSNELRRLAALRTSAPAALGCWVLVGSVSAFHTKEAFGAALVSIALSSAFSAVWAITCATRRSRLVLAAVAIVSIGAAVLVRGAPALTCLAAMPAAALLIARRSEDDDRPPAWIAAILDHPARLVVSTFAALVFVGTALLALPLSSSSARSIGLVDAAFTSVSAVCVTGLIVLDTPNAFTVFGQVMILGLIQIGGLGIMSFYTVALHALGRRISLRHELTIAGTVGLEDSGSVFGAFRRVLVVTAACELIGAIVLTIGFAAHGHSIGTAIWRGVFTSISAFCNAGFALQTDNLVPYQTNLIILHAVATLIVLGGLSPLAIVSLPRLLRRRPVPLQVKLVYAATALLLVGGALLYGAFEWSESLVHLSRVDRAHNAWFQSVTLRTAGFNSVDLTETREATRTLMMVLMLIGGSPGGTAGGIKTTTAALLVLAVVTALRGRPQVVAFGRHIRHTSVYKAAAVSTIVVLLVLAAVVAVQVTQRMPFDVGVFEVISGFATVGLSLGGTALLDGVGKVILMFCMFLGRIGPLTLFLFLVDRRPEPDWDYPDEGVDVG